MTPRCGKPMRRYEAANGPLPEDPSCGRPAGHNGPCRSVQFLDRERPKHTARSTRDRWRYPRRSQERSRAA